MKLRVRFVAGGYLAAEGTITGHIRIQADHQRGLDGRPALRMDIQTTDVAGAPRADVSGSSKLAHQLGTKQEDQLQVGH